MDAAPHSTEKARFNLLGIVLRLLTLGGKFLLVIYLVKYVSLVDLGIYGLFVATNLIAVYVIGFEFDQYAMREILRVEPDDRPKVVWSQARFYAAGYLVAVPAFVTVFAAGFLPWRTAVFFFPVLLGTHASMSVHRLLIAVSRPLAAYVVSAGAHGVWVFAAIGLGLVEPSLRDLDVVLGSWAVTAVVTAVVSIAYVRRLGLFDGGPSQGSWRRVREGLSTSFILFCASLAYRVVELADRYFIQVFRGEAQVGVYTLFSRVAAVLHEVVFVGVVAVILPRLVHSYQHGDAAAYARNTRRLFRSICLVTLGMLPALVLGIYVLLLFVDNGRVDEALPAYFVLLGGTSVLNLSLNPHYALFAWKRDRLILMSTAVAAVVNVALNAVFVPRYGVLGAAIATAAAFTAMAAVKQLLWFRSKAEHALH